MPTFQPSRALSENDSALMADPNAAMFDSATGKWLQREGAGWIEVPAPASGQPPAQILSVTPEIQAAAEQVSPAREPPGQPAVMDPNATGEQSLTPTKGRLTDVPPGEAAPAPKEGVAPAEAPQIGLPAKFGEAERLSAKAAQAVTDAQANPLTKELYERNLGELRMHESDTNAAAGAESEASKAVAAIGAQQEAVRILADKQIAETQTRLADFQRQLAIAQQTGSKELADYSADARTSAFWGSIIARGMGMLGTAVSGRGMQDINAGVAKQIVEQAEAAIDMETKRFTGRVAGIQGQIQGENKLIKTLRDTMKDDIAALAAYKDTRRQEFIDLAKSHMTRANSAEKRMGLAQTIQTMEQKKTQDMTIAMGKHADQITKTAQAQLAVNTTNLAAKQKATTEAAKDSDKGQTQFSSEFLVKTDPSVKDLSPPEKRDLSKKMSVASEMIRMDDKIQKEFLSIPGFANKTFKDVEDGVRYFAQAKALKGQMQALMRKVTESGAALTKTEMPQILNRTPDSFSWFVDVQKELSTILTDDLLAQIETAGRIGGYSPGPLMKSKKVVPPNPLTEVPRAR